MKMNNKKYDLGIIAFLVSAYLILGIVKDRLFGVKEYPIKTPSTLDKNNDLW